MISTGSISTASMAAASRVDRRWASVSALVLKGDATIRLVLRSRRKVDAWSLLATGGIGRNGRQRWASAWIVDTGAAIHVRWDVWTFDH